MKTVLMGLMAAGITAAFVASPAAAQQRAWGFGGHGSYFKSGNLAEGSASTGGSDDTFLQLDNKGSFGFNVEVWPGMGRWGLRANADRTKSPWILDTDGRVTPGIVAGQAALDAVGDEVGVWMADANLMVRILPMKVDRWFAPFVSVGGGFIRWDHETDGNAIDLRVQEADVQIFGNAQTEFAATGSIGTDLFFMKNIALRLEGKDYWNPRSPYIRLSEINDTDGNRHQVGGHNLVFSAGLSFLFGRPEETPGFISEAPVVEETEVVEAPPPAPTTEQVNMCYVDQNGRLETISATRNLSTNQVYVTQNGSEVAFSTAYPTTEPLYIQNADWYVASRPLVLDLGNGTTITTADVDVNTIPNRIEFVNFGSAMPIEASDLTYVGSINGTPLYARSSDLGDFQVELDTRLRTTNDLNRLLSDQAFADRYVNAIQTFYMPVQPGTQCMFQPVSSTHVVRRTRG